jgi:hypothetical protein
VADRPLKKGRKAGFINRTQEINPMSRLKTTFIGATLAIATLGAFAQTPATPRADQREVNQQGRIAQGAASGELTGRETNRLEKEQAAINRTEARAKADGRVTKHERRHLHRMQNAASKDIRHQKHDGQVAAKP